MFSKARIFGAVALVATIFSSMTTTTTAYSLSNLPTNGPLTDEAAHNLFAAYLKKFNKTYPIDEVNQRLNIFRENVDWMIKWNADPENTSTVGINQFADLGREEWASFLGLRFPDGWASPEEFENTLEYYDNLPDEENTEYLEIADLPQVLDQPNKLDWTVEERDSAGKITRPRATLSIRNQGSCGSCYSFSAMAALEGLYRINYYDKIDKFEYFSPQQGVDCTGPRYSNSYCQGGFMHTVFQYVKDNGGICWEKNYPYQNRAGTCRSSQCRPAFVNSGYRDLTGHSENTLLKHLAVNPLSIAVTSGVPQFMYYKSGILTYCGNQARPDHAVNAVGYDLTAAIPFVKVRNSWAASWGEQGHIRMALGYNMCKWRHMVSYPILSMADKEAQLAAFTEETSPLVNNEEMSSEM